MKANFYTRVGLIKAQIIPDLPTESAENKDYINSIWYLSYMLLNPDSWTDTKPANWIKHQVPGRSDPIQQWLASGVRSVSFDALVTADLADDAGLDPHLRQYPTSSRSTSRGAIVNRLGNIGRQIFNIPNISLPDLRSNKNAQENEPLSITDWLDYYRSFTYPFVDKNRIKSPMPVRLIVGEILGKRNVSNSMFVIDKVEVKVIKEYPTLTPIEAVVSFNLSEIVDTVISSTSVI